MLLLLLYSLGLRAFLFSIKFQHIRGKLASKHSLIHTFLTCSFCNGFWCGLFIFIAFAGIQWEMFIFAITVGFLSNTLNSFINKRSF